MNVSKKQCLLKYLGYYDGRVDGIWGAGSAQATRDLQTASGLNPDGIFGDGTLAAAKEAVANDRFKTQDKPERPQGPEAEGKPVMEDAAQYLQADGCYHIPRGVDVQLTKNFWAREIHCQGKGCCTESVISKRIMDLAQAIRDDLDEPLSIATAGGSGYRCPVHNSRVSGAAKNSLHTISDAVDLHYHDPDKLKAVVLRHLTDGEVGRYPWGCHVGCWDRGYVNQFR